MLRGDFFVGTLRVAAFGTAWCQWSSSASALQQRSQAVNDPRFLFFFTRQDPERSNKKMTRTFTSVPKGPLRTDVTVPLAQPIFPSEDLRVHSHSPVFVPRGADVSTTRHCAGTPAVHGTHGPLHHSTLAHTDATISRISSTVP